MARKTKNRLSPKRSAHGADEYPSTPTEGEQQPDSTGTTKASRLRPGLMILIALMIVGLLIRVSSLPNLSLWMDEYVHVMRAKNFLNGSGPLFTDDNNGILLTLSLLPGFALFGAKVFWARFPSVLFGVGLIYVVYRMGTHLFNRFVGLFAAGAATLSLYLIFWSRVCRNYAPLSVFYLLLGLVFLLAFESRPNPESPDPWTRLGLSKRHLWWVPVVGRLSFLSHQLTFFFVFTVGIYSLVRLAGTYWTAEEKAGRTRYAWMTALSLPFLLVVFVPPVGEALKTGLDPFLLSNIAEWAIPNWTRVAALSSEKPLEAFNVYNSILQYDLNGLYIPALLGLAAALWLKPRAGLWLLCSFAVPFMLMSFVFREPFLRRYLIFIYPYLLIAAGVFFYALWEILRTRVWPNLPQKAGAVLAVAPFLLLLFNTHWRGIADLALARQLEGHIVDTRISSWSFTNWEEACDYVAAKRKPGDLLIATVPAAASYYLDTPGVLWFRQAYYDTRSKSYKLNSPDPNGGPSASSFEDLVRTVQQTPRGWLLADYYLENVFTDERALLWVYQNMHFYPEASPDGSIMVFGWDHTQPKPERQNLVVELGHSDDKIESKEYHMTLPEALFTNDQIELTVRTRWVDSNREALVLFNGANAVWLPPNRGSGIEEAVLPLQRNWIRPGRNTIQILYETKRPSDPRKGFTLYFLSITGK